MRGLGSAVSEQPSVNAGVVLFDARTEEHHASTSASQVPHPQARRQRASEGHSCSANTRWRGGGAPLMPIGQGAAWGGVVGDWGIQP